MGTGAAGMVRAAFAAGARRVAGSDIAVRAVREEEALISAFGPRGREHPLAAALPEWRVLPDVMRGTHVYLHPSGLWFETDAFFADTEIDADAGAAVAAALRCELDAGGTGLVVLQAIKGESGVGWSTARIGGEG